MFKTVLFPIDQSRASLEAAETVANIVQKYESRLVILSVLEKDEAGGTMADASAVAQLLQSVQAMFNDKGIPSEVIEREGVPAFTICDVADETEADLIIMGCRGLGLTDENKSVTNRVINLSPCAVMVVP
jgi:nucleotide-binding universal stress UspA family protein